MTKDKLPNPERWLDIEVCEIIYKTFKDIASDYGVDSPIPDFKSRYPGVLESILGSVQFRSWAEGLDIGMTASYYFVSLVKSQAFLDANKRNAVLMTDTFLRINGYKLGVNKNLLRNIAIFISLEENKGIPNLVEEMAKVFKIVPLNKPEK